MKQNKMITSIENSLWQSMPLLSTFLISFLIVRWFSVAVWGSVVSVLVVQQIVNGVLSWGNKDYLQRELRVNPSSFSQLFVERFLLFFLIILVIFATGFVQFDYFFSFVLVVFFRFITQSFDVLIIMKRKFKWILLMDFLLLLFQVFLLFCRKDENTDLNDLLQIFWMPQAFKSIILLLIFRSDFRKINFEKILIFNSFFFALLTISGLINSKIDIFLVSQLVDIEVLGKYQIVMTFLWSIQSISMYISGPFVHNFYRLNSVSQKKSSALLKNIGFFIVPISVGIAMMVLNYLFAIEINASIIIASLFFGFASFIYLPWIFQIYQKKLEHRILIINCIGSIILFGSIYLMNTIFGLTLERILWVNTFQQILIVLFAYAANTILKHEK